MLKKMFVIVLLLLLLMVSAISFSTNATDVTIAPINTLEKYNAAIAKCVLPYNFIPYESIASFGRFRSCSMSGVVTRFTYCLVDETGFTIEVQIEYSESYYKDQLAKPEITDYSGGDPRMRPDGYYAMRRGDIIYKYNNEGVNSLHFEVNGAKVSVDAYDSGRGLMNYRVDKADTMMTRLLSSDSDTFDNAVVQLYANMPKIVDNIAVRKWIKIGILTVVVLLVGAAAVCGVSWLKRHERWKLGKKKTVALIAALVAVVGIFVAQRFDYCGAYRGMSAADFYTLMPPSFSYKRGYCMRQGEANYYTNGLGYGVFVEFSENNREITKIRTFSCRKPTIFHGMLLREGMTKAQVVKLMGMPCGDAISDTLNMTPNVYNLFQTVDGTIYKVYWDYNGDGTANYVEIIKDQQWISCAVIILALLVVIAVVKRRYFFKIFAVVLVLVAFCGVWFFEFFRIQFGPEDVRQTHILQERSETDTYPCGRDEVFHVKSNMGLYNFLLYRDWLGNDIMVRYNYVYKGRELGHVPEVTTVRYFRRAEPTHLDFANVEGMDAYEFIRRVGFPDSHGQQWYLETRYQMYDGTEYRVKFRSKNGVGLFVDSVTLTDADGSAVDLLPVRLIAALNWSGAIAVGGGTAVGIVKLLGRWAKKKQH